MSNFVVTLQEIKLIVGTIYKILFPYDTMKLSVTRTSVRVLFCFISIKGDGFIGKNIRKGVGNYNQE